LPRSRPTLRSPWREIEAILDFASSLVEEKGEGCKVVELFGEDRAEA
jgi:hypothetical protein